MLLYVADTNNNRLRAVLPTGVVTTLAGSGSAGWVDDGGLRAAFSGPIALSFDPARALLYVADTGNNRLRAVDLSGSGGAAVTTLAGIGPSSYTADGGAGVGTLSSPSGLALSADGATLWVADRGSNRVRALSIASGSLVTFAGTGVAGSANGPLGLATFNAPFGVVVLPDGALVVSETGASGHTLRALTCPLPSPTGTPQRLALCGRAALTNALAHGASRRVPRCGRGGRRRGGLPGRHRRQRAL